MRTSRALATTAGVALAVLAPAAPATAAPVVCGDTLSGEVVLTADLVCSGTSGLELTDGTTLDLGGHRLVGDGSYAGIVMAPDADVTIRNGVVRGNGTGVSPHWENLTGRTGHVTIDGVTARDNREGVSVDGLIGQAPEVEIVSSRFVGNGTGVSGLQAQGIAVTSSRFVDNGTGVYVAEGRTYVEVLDSVFAHNTTAVGCGESGGCTVVDSTLRDNQVGVSLTTTSATVRGTTIVRNDIGVGCTVGSVTVEASVVRDNRRGVQMLNCGGSVLDSTFLRNDVGLWGENLDEPVPDLTLEGNTFRRNGDGLLLRAELGALGGNTAVRNERWGIHAPGAVDLGGNTARGNGNEPQCVGVTCAAGPVS